MYIPVKMVTATCSRCKSTIDISYFGINRQNEPHKTCDNCRNRNKKKTITVTTQQIQKPIMSFVQHYVNLPIIHLDKKQEFDMLLTSIVVLNHEMVFEPEVKRFDNEGFQYKEFTELDPVEYNVGVNPYLDYMLDDYVTPVLLKINGNTYRASCLMWFPLTDAADGLKLKMHKTNEDVFPIFINKGLSPFPAIVNTCLKYYDQLSATEAFEMHIGYVNSEINENNEIMRCLKIN